MLIFDPGNLPYWILLGIGVFLFILVIVSGGGDDDLDVDTDVDVDLDADIDTDIDTDIDLNADIEGAFSPIEILGWLGIGKAPLILLLAIDFSTWGFTGWLLNVSIGSLFGAIPGGFFSGVIMLVSFSISLSVGKLLSYPLGKIFSDFGEDASSDRLIGCVGKVVSKKIPYLTSGKIGQADVIDAAGNIITVSVSLPQWSKVIPHQGQEILIIEQHPDCYLAIAKDSSDEDKWLTNN